MTIYKEKMEMSYVSALNVFVFVGLATVAYTCKNVENILKQLVVHVLSNYTAFAMVQNLLGVEHFLWEGDGGVRVNLFIYLCVLERYFFNKYQKPQPFIIYFVISAISIHKQLSNSCHRSGKGLL